MACKKSRRCATVRTLVEIDSLQPWFLGHRRLPWLEPLEGRVARQAIHTFRDSAERPFSWGIVEIAVATCLVPTVHNAPQNEHGNSDAEIQRVKREWLPKRQRTATDRQ